MDTHDDEETVTRAAFSARWREAFLGCHRGNIDQTMDGFTRELLKVANRLLSRTSVAMSNTNNARRRAPPADTNESDPAPRFSAGIQQRRRRNQHRHQQRRARRHHHHRPEDASKLQKLYGRYPRKVLGEESPYYSGGRDRLRQYIAETYHHRTVSRDQVAEARRLYDNCNWEPPTEEELEALQSPHSADEVLGGDLSIAWLDLTNAFGAIPHPVLGHLFQSLPIPDLLRQHLTDIYTDNHWEFVCEEGSVEAQPVSGVRQGDGLSPIIFNLASEPLVRAAAEGQRTQVFGRTVRNTTYADDTAVLARTPADLQTTLDHMDQTATSIGLSFNPVKCSSLTFRGGSVIPAPELRIQGGAVKTLEEEDTETYLGIPTGAKLLYRPGTELPKKMNLLQESLLAPWQKLEVLRSQLIPSLSTI